MTEAGATPSNKGKTLPPEMFVPDEISRLLDACPTTPWGLRLRAYIVLLYRTGEASEALALTRAHVDLTEGQGVARVLPTRLTARTLALDETVCGILREWLEVRDSFPGDHVCCVLRGKTAGTARSDVDARRSLRELGVEVLGKRLHPGAFRVTLTAELIVEQWPLPYIQTQLGLQSFYSFKEIFPKLGIRPAPEAEVAEVARARPWRTEN